MRTFLAAVMLFIVFGSILSVFSMVILRTAEFVMQQTNASQGISDVLEVYHVGAARMAALLAIALAFIVVLAAPRTIRERVIGE